MGHHEQKTEKQQEILPRIRRPVPRCVDIDYVAGQSLESGGYVILPHGSVMFRVPGWLEKDLSRAFARAARCENVLSLEKAFRNARIPVLLIKKNALLTDKNIWDVCQRNGVAKTIFKLGNK